MTNLYTKKEETREKALELFNDRDNSYSCSQGVFGSLADLFGFDRNFALRASAAFGGGIGGTHEGPCGAMNGALMGVGFCIDSLSDRKGRTKLAAQLLSAFEDKWGKDVSCSELLRKSNLKEIAANDSRLSNLVSPRPCSIFVADAIDIFFDVCLA